MGGGREPARSGCAPVQPVGQGRGIDPALGGAQAHDGECPGLDAVVKGDLVPANDLGGFRNGQECLLHAECLYDRHINIKANTEVAFVARNMLPLISVCRPVGPVASRARSQQARQTAESPRIR